MNKEWFKEFVTVEKVIVLSIALIFMVASILIILNSDWYNAPSAIATLWLVFAAILAAQYARRNIEIIKLSNRNRLFLQLMSDLGDSKAREYRGIVFAVDKELQRVREGKHPWRYYTRDVDITNFNNNIEAIKKIIEYGQGLVSDSEDRVKVAQDAIEETIALLDRVGYFLLHGKDEMLARDAPTSIWAISKNMNDVIGDYLIDRQTNGKDPHYGKYFVELAAKSEEMLKREV